MSTIKQCYYCGKTFEDKGGLNESPRVKNGPFGQAHTVCSLKCKREFNDLTNVKENNSHSSQNESVNNNDSIISKIGCFIGLLLLIAIVLGMKYLILGTVEGDPFK